MKTTKKLSLVLLALFLVSAGAYAQKVTVWQVSMQLLKW